MAEIGEPQRRRVLVPDETPAPTPIVEPVKVPEREPVEVPQREPVLISSISRLGKPSRWELRRPIAFGDMLSRLIMPLCACCHGSPTRAGTHVGSSKGQHRTKASKASTASKPWMTCSSPFATSRSTSSYEVRSRDATVSFSERSRCGESFGITPKDTERSSRGPCLLFQVTAIGANRHWPNCVPSFPTNPRCKKSLLMVEYHGDMLWGVLQPQGEKLWLILPSTWARQVQR